MRNNRQRYLERRKNKAPLPKKIKVSKRDNMGKFNSFTVASFFIGIVLVGVFSSRLAVTQWQMAQVYALCFAVGLCIPIKFYRKKFTMSFYEFILFNAISFPFLVMLSIIIINYSYTGKPYVETYKVVGVTKKGYMSYIYTLENDAYDYNEALRTVGQDSYSYKKGSTNYVIKMRDGLLGIKIIEEKLVY